MLLDDGPLRIQTVQVIIVNAIWMSPEVSGGLRRSPEVSRGFRRSQEVSGGLGASPRPPELC
eukprot:4870890-Alexandrium_andersonii.AAC.1